MSLRAYGTLNKQRTHKAATPAETPTEDTHTHTKAHTHTHTHSCFSGLQLTDLEGAEADP